MQRPHREALAFITEKELLPGKQKYFTANFIETFDETLLIRLPTVRQHDMSEHW